MTHMYQFKAMYEHLRGTLLSHLEHTRTWYAAWEVLARVCANLAQAIGDGCLTSALLTNGIPIAREDAMNQSALRRGALLQSLPFSYTNSLHCGRGLMYL